MNTEYIRNVALISHGGAGKTSLAEAILYNTGSTKRLGDSSNNGNMDFDPVELKRKISVNLKVATVKYNNYELNLIDTPGYSNFLHESICGLWAAGSAVVIASAITGIKAETKRVWNYADEFSLSKIIFINKMDKDRADFDKAIYSVEKAFGVKVVPVVIPVGAADSFKGLIDLIAMKFAIYDNGKKSLTDIPSEYQSKAEDYRQLLLEAASELDDSLLEKYLDTGSLDEDEILFGLREGTVTKKLVPVICGSAQLNIGVDYLLKAVADMLPSPDEEQPRIALDKTIDSDTFVDSNDEEFSGYVFKTISDPFSGKLSYIRILSGTLKADSIIYNSNRKEKESIGNIYKIQGKNQIKVNEATCGQIVMVNRLKFTSTFDSLCSLDKNLYFYPPDIGNQVISFSIVPKSKDDEDKVSVGLSKLIEEDPGLRLKREQATSELLLYGMGQMHIEVTLEKLVNKFNVDVDMKIPKVPYQETVRSSAAGQGKYKKQSGGRGQYGDVWIEIEPLPRGSGFQFEDRIVGGVVPRNYIPAVEKGIREAMNCGVISDYPMVDFKVTLYDGSYHSVDSSELAFKVAASMAYKRVAANADPMLLEPIMSMDVYVPEDYVGAVIGDINSRRGRILNVQPQKSGQHIKAEVPMSEVLTYAPDLRGMTGGYGYFTMSLASYEELPGHLLQSVIKK